VPVEDLAAMLGVSRRTFYQRRREWGGACAWIASRAPTPRERDGIERPDKGRHFRSRSTPRRSRWHPPTVERDLEAIEKINRAARAVHRIHRASRARRARAREPCAHAAGGGAARSKPDAAGQKTPMTEIPIPMTSSELAADG